ncbi:MAG: NADH-quinone oxidoreductase subunit M [Phycisphaeraceae bacterium]|nr:NADH-quinone oxidoreductase subunit M [Phycisphaeraceae bacterium]MCW5755511.1 NADH-quinone oxidoreductase subunit M [Phycisphaeraceae bacterium]
MTSALLAILILVPIAGSIIVALRPAAQAKSVALLTTLLALIGAAVALVQFDWTRAEAYQGVGRIDWVPDLGLSLSVGVDSVALLLVALTALLGPICVAASFTAITHRVKTYYAWLLVLQGAMTGVFCARDLIVFYTCFEFTLIPMYILISLYGSTNRKKAATKFFLYTFTGSVLTLAGLIYLVWFNATQLPVGLFQGSGRWTFDMAALRDAGCRMSLSQQTWILAAMLAGFAVKIPLFPVHTWLPLAHTEAPTAGSVILAGVLLKLGTYGMYRFVLPYTPSAIVEYAPFLAFLCIMGIVYAGLICWVQDDIKKLVAYSSVSHLGFCILGLVALNGVGVSGSVLYMLNHGLSTGALFLLIGMMYERYHTRSMREIGGLAARMPIWATFMVFFAMASVGLPGLNGFVSEFMCLMGAFQASDALVEAGQPGATPGRLGPWYAAVAGTGMIIAAMYILIMVGKACFGPLREPHHHHHHDDPASLPADLSAREIGVLAPLAVLCLVLGLYPTPVLKALEAPVNDTVSWVHEQAPKARGATPTRVTWPSAPDADAEGR